MIFKLFFSQIKSKVGVIEPQVFMSDDAPAYYNAWSIIMGDVPHRLLCTWHVDRNWRKKLCEIKGGPEKKSLVYKTLRVLLQITSIDEFKACQDQVINDLLKDEDTNAFGVYFKENYSKRSEVWAYCYRLRKGINTNVYLEAFHKVLKHIYLEGKKCQRLDKTINAVMKINRDMIFKRLIKISKNIMTSKEKKNCESHTRGE